MLVLGVLLVAAIVRLADAWRSPLVLDEIYGVVLVRAGLRAALHTLTHDIDQPLNFVLLWIWRRIGGEGERWIKLLPVTLGVLTVAALAGFGRELFGRRAALVAALLLALHPAHVTWSIQAVYHVLEWLLYLLAAWCQWRWLRHGRARDAAGWVACTAALLYTSYYAYLLVASLVVLPPVLLRREPRRALQAAGLAALAFLLWAPQAPVAWRQSAGNVLEGLPYPPLPASQLVELLRKLCFGALYLAPVLLASSAAVLVRRRSRDPGAYVLFLFAMPLVLTWVATERGVHIYILRQQFFTIPFACLLVAAGLAQLPWPRVGTGVAVALVAVAARAWALKGPLPEAVDLGRAADWLRAHARRGDLVVCTETHALFFARWHLGREVDVRLMLVPGSVPFHYSDGILVMTSDWTISPRRFRAEVAGGRPWWGLRMAHAGRVGPLAAKQLTRSSRGDTLMFGRATIWRGPAPAAATAAASLTRP